MDAKVKNPYIDWLHVLFKSCALEVFGVGFRESQVASPTQFQLNLNTPKEAGDFCLSLSVKFSCSFVIFSPLGIGKEQTPFLVKNLKCFEPLRMSLIVNSFAVDLQVLRALMPADVCSSSLLLKQVLSAQTT